MREKVTKISNYTTGVTGVKWIVINKWYVRLREHRGTQTKNVFHVHDLKDAVKQYVCRKYVCPECNKEAPALVIGADMSQVL